MARPSTRTRARWSWRALTLTLTPDPNPDPDPDSDPDPDPKPNQVVVEKCKKYGKIAGFWNSDVTGKAEMGFRFLVVDGDIHSMQAALTTSLKEKRELMEKAGVL